MRICYFGTYSDQPGYPMNRVLLAGLKAAGAQVTTCHARVWDDAADKMAGVGGGVLSRGVRLLWAWLLLTVRFARLPDYDVLVVGYVGHLDVFLARFLSLFRRRPVVLNALVSLHDTVVLDRKMVAESSLLARLLWWLDRSAFRLADRILIDTAAHADHLARSFDIPRHKWIQVAVGADPHGLPETPPPPPADGPLTVLYFGTYIALHGVATILDAARILAPRDDIHFHMLGKGQELKAMQRYADGLANVRFEARWVGREALLRQVAAADLCLGVFGTGAKAARVVPCKVFDALAMGRPVVSAANAAITELLTDGRDAVLIPAGDGAALAAAIARLADDRAARLALGAAGRATFLARCTHEAIGRALLAELATTINPIAR